MYMYKDNMMNLQIIVQLYYCNIDKWTLKLRSIGGYFMDIMHY